MIRAALQREATSKAGGRQRTGAI